MNTEQSRTMLRTWLTACLAALLTALLATLLPTPAHGAPLTRAQALAALAKPEAHARRAGVERLATIGAAADAGPVLDRLADANPGVREAAAAAAWQIWGRSGDPAIDQLYARGLAHMQAAALPQALATFSEVVRRKPAFAEGWNKRATIYFLLGENDKSLQDCAEVFKRNPRHFGALSGAAQIHLQRGNLRLALELFRQALDVNPNLEGAALTIELIELRLRNGERSAERSTI